MLEYDKIAPDYQKMVRNIETPVVMPEIYTFSQMIGDVKEKTILDLGCGEGIYTRRIAELHPKKVMGVDISIEMIHLAKQEEQRHPLGIEYIVTDTRQMESFGQFDMVTSFFMLNHAQTRDELFNMCRSIAENLKSGGRFFGFNNNLELPPERYPLMEKYGRRQHAHNPLYEGATIQVWYFDGEKECSFTDFYLSHTTYEQVLESVGFKEIKWHPPKVCPEHIVRFGEAFWQDYFNNPTMIVLEAIKR